MHDEVIGGNVGVGDYLENCRSVGWHQPSGLAHHRDAGPRVCHYVDVPGAAFNFDLVIRLFCHLCDVKSWIYTVKVQKSLKMPQKVVLVTFLLFLTNQSRTVLKTTN